MLAYVHTNTTSVILNISPVNVHEEESGSSYMFDRYVSSIFRPAEIA